MQLTERIFCWEVTICVICDGVQKNFHVFFIFKNKQRTYQSYEKIFINYRQSLKIRNFV
jgi:hypothetical protein